MGQNLNELEAQYRGGLPNAAEEEQNQKQQLVIKAMSQAQLVQRYRQMKELGQDEINKKAEQITEAAAQDPSSQGDKPLIDNDR